ncbi:putative gluconokinase [Neolecta irregularis DAH-3]|uniref:Gluconokinase n=1 Tax=Neolecta irregularis (strain DAH-3) TaxID=1198029 RepID=A0A1U7LT15_NEOID|nr:putative gluconokinase [Neolecta irregularis DAH-3]|eukprot:OLL25816.1 putative gluconokinase [Neolecta irregularis DAH-3]
MLTIAGCGKTTVSKALSAYYNYIFIEGDDFHSSENIAKMTNGIPLNDFDRSVWLDQIVKTIAVKAMEPGTLGITVACSALKKIYRLVLKKAETSQNVEMFFLFLKLDIETLQNRITARKGHFMKKEMLDSQLKTLESPECDESNVIIVDARGTPAEVNQLAFRQWGRILEEKKTGGLSE